ncbi:tetratricopeptide repeat protein [Streptomyces zaomyceticus]|uniref:tetratricopeptide repeat protein n=1 Tax=Streptomyces zaomyceticus TaxID=68286 RepID=UPI0036B56BD5
MSPRPRDRGQGALTPAIEAFRRALSALKRLVGDGHPDTMTSRNNLAVAYMSAGN